MPPRITQSSLRPRVSDRTMVGTFATALLEKRSDRTTSQTLMSRNSRSPLPHRNRSANMPGHPHPRGWMSRNTPSTRTEGLCFLLTSPFIERAQDLRSSVRGRTLRSVSGRTLHLHYHFIRHAAVIVDVINVASEIPSSNLLWYNPVNNSQSSEDSQLLGNGGAITPSGLLLNGCSNATEAQLDAPKSKAAWLVVLFKLFVSVRARAPAHSVRRRWWWQWRCSPGAPFSGPDRHAVLGRYLSEQHFHGEYLRLD